jgi:hypothetical protein
VRTLALALTLLQAHAAVAGEAPAVRRKPDDRYVISGAALLGVFYAASLALAIRYEEGELAVPVVGPLIDLRRCRDCTASSAGQAEVAGLVLDAAVQAAGVGLLALGLARRRLARVSVAPTPTGIVVGGRF